MGKARNKNQKGKNKNNVEKLTLKDDLDTNVLQKLQQAKKQLETAEEDKIAAEKARKLEERKQREKNKSFEELLDETSLNWRDFK